MPTSARWPAASRGPGHRGGDRGIRRSRAGDLSRARARAADLAADADSRRLWSPASARACGSTDDYATSSTSLAGHVSAAVANARAYEEESRRAEALAELDRAKTAFFSNVSHEFRTPLTLMLGPVEDLLAKPGDQLSPADRDQLEVVHRNGLRLLKLVNTLLDFSRIEAGRVRAVYQPTDLAAFTAELASNFRSAVRAGRADAEGRLPAAARAGLRRPGHVGEDRPQPALQRLQVHLRRRDRRHASADGPARASWPCATRARAFRAEEIPRLFERFHRVEDARGRTHEGTGIGLALVQELVKLHGGTIGSRAPLDQGSTFTVSHARRARPTCRPTGSGCAHAGLDRARGRALRRGSAALAPGDGSAPARAPASTVAGPAAASERPGAASSVADDNADMREYIRRLLAERYEVEAVADGEAALAAARARRRTWCSPT